MNGSTSWILLVAAAAASAAGCGKRVDGREAEATIRAWAEQSVGPVSSVRCDPAPLRAGATFACVVTFAGGARHVLDVTQRDDRGTAAWRWRTPVVGADRLATFLAEQLEADDPGRPMIVDCGEGIRVIPAEGVTCAVTSDAGRVELAVTTDGQRLAWAPRPGG